MKQFLISCLLLVSVAVQAQQLNPTRVFPVGNQIAIGELNGSLTYYPSSVVTVTFGTTSVRLQYQSSSGYLNPADFLNSAGAPYGATLVAAQAGWNAAVIVNATVYMVGGSTGGSSGTGVTPLSDNLTTTTTGTALDARQGSVIKGFIDQKLNINDSTNFVRKLSGYRLLAPAEQTKLSNLSGTNTGDETAATIRSKLGVTTLSGVNSGDQTLTYNNGTLTISGSNGNSVTIPVSTSSGGSTPLANNLTTTTTGSALDATQGKRLSDSVGVHRSEINTAKTTLAQKADAINVAFRTVPASFTHLTGQPQSQITVSAATTITITSQPGDAGQIAITRTNGTEAITFAGADTVRLADGTVRTYTGYLGSTPGKVSMFYYQNVNGTPKVETSSRDFTPDIAAVRTLAQNAQTTATQAQTTAASNTTALGNKADKATTISVNGSAPQSLAGNVSITIPVGGNFVLQSASPYVPVSTSGTSATITDALSTVLGIPVFVRDQASIQTLINSLPNSTTAIPRLLFFGKYDFSANANTPLTISKNIELVGINQASFDGGTVNGFLTLFNSISTRLLVENITFRSNSTTSAYALTYFNEQGDCRNVTFRRCRWHAPKGNYNAIGLNTWNGTSGSFMENFLFEECVVDSVGRMGGEGLAQKNDGVIRIKNLTWNNCRFDNVGLYNPANVTKASAQINGMALSISGDIQGVQINNFVARNALVGIELVSVKDVNIINPTITGARSSTYSDAGIIGATGISITDGGSTDRGITGRSATNITITGGSISMAGKGLGTYYADRLTVTGTKFNAGAYMEIQHATRLNFNSFDYEMTGKNFIASFEDVKNSQIRNIRFSRENNTVTPIYQPINLDGNTANNQFSEISIVTNTAVNGGNPDNYYNDQQPFRLRYINEAGTNNSLLNIFLNGQKQPDAVYELIPTLSITAAGTVAALTHISRINVNPASTIASLNLTLPPTTQDNKQVEIVVGGTLTSGTVATSLTISGPSGTGIVQSNTPTSASAGQVFIYRYNAVTGKYHRY